MIVPPRVLDLVRRLGPDALPAYVYDLGALDAHAAAIRAALPRAVEFHYAVKANPDARVLRSSSPAHGWVRGLLRWRARAHGRGCP